MPKKQRDPSGRSPKSGPEGSRINARALRAVMGDERATLVRLRAELKAEQGERRRVLLRVIKGLLRTGELVNEGGGEYRFASARPIDDAAVLATPDASSRASTSQSLIGVLTREARYPFVEVLGGGDIKKVFVPAAEAQGYEQGDTVRVALLGEDRYGHQGTLKDRLARGGGAAQAAETLLESYDVPREWPNAFAAVVERLPNTVAPASYRGREDLRSMPLVTIDGETARDFDDAAYAERAGSGWRLVVAIADVAHYVDRGSPLDEEAALRGNSVYLPDRVIPMLPEALSNGLCSLRPKERRLAMVCDMQITASGRVSRHRFYNAVIESWARLTYLEVGGFLDGAELKAPVEVLDSLRALHDLYGALRQAREARGALDFGGREANVVLENDRVLKIEPVTRNDAHRLIEEAMIAANVCAAQTLEQAEVFGMYRVHEPPTAEKTEQLRQALAYTGVRLPKGELSSEVVQQALRSIAAREDGWLLETLVLRALSQARYTPTNKGHFGLALNRYMHFTSPIRRYADLLVHRALKAVIADKAAGTRLPKGAALYELDELLAIGEHLCATERRADEVSWGVAGWLKCEYMGQFVGETLGGIVAAVTEFGLFVELDGYYVQGLLHISELGRDYFHYEALNQSLVGERSGRRFSLGQSIEVLLVNVNPPRGRIELRLPESDSARGRSRRRQ